MLYEKVYRMIENKEYETKATKESWAGAGAAITAEFKENYQNDSSVEYYCTPDAKYYIWLLEECKDYVYGDYLNKYESCPRFVRIVKEADKKDSTIQSKLFEVFYAVHSSED